MRRYLTVSVTTNEQEVPGKRNNLTARLEMDSRGPSLGEVAKLYMNFVGMVTENTSDLLWKPSPLSLACYSVLSK